MLRSTTDCTMFHASDVHDGPGEKVTTLLPLAGSAVHDGTESWHWSADCVVRIFHHAEGVVVRYEDCDAAEHARCRLRLCLPSCVKKHEVAICAAFAEAQRKGCKPSGVQFQIFGMALTVQLDASHMDNPLSLRRLVHALAMQADEIMLAQSGERGSMAAWQELKAKAYMGAGIEGSMSIARVADVCGMSTAHFTRAFHRSVGVPPHRWLLEHRIARSRLLLACTSHSLSDIAMACGFAEQSHFTRVFNRYTGTSPGAWRRQRETSLAA